MLDSIFRLTDVAIIATASITAHWVKFNELSISDHHFFFTVILLFITINVFSALSVYKGWQQSSFLLEIKRLTICWLIIILMAGALTFFTKTGPNFSREWAALTFLITYFGFISYRFIFRKIIQKIQKTGYNQKKIIIIGADKLGQRACNAMQKQSWAGLVPIAFFDNTHHQKNYYGIEVKGAIKEAHSFIERNRLNNPIDQVWITLPLTAQKEIEELQLTLEDTATKIYFIPDLFVFNLASYDVDEMVGLPVMNMSAPPTDGLSSTLKRIEDLSISFISLIILSPLFLIVAILIKRDSKGSVFFKQRRYGLDGKEILVWKFRSMSTADNGTEIKQAGRNDARVTKVGAILRKTSIDELPQLFNVLFGSMSLVGPRPHAVAHNEFYRTKVQGYMVRHQVRPGITGWAQVNGSRGETVEVDDMRTRIRYDLEYIRNWSIFLDIKIIFMTFKTLTNTKNTY